MLLPLEERRRWGLRDALNLESVNHWLHFLPWLAHRLANGNRRQRERLTPTQAIWAKSLTYNTEASRNRVLNVMRLVAERNASAINEAVRHYIFVPYVFFPLEDEGLLLEQSHAARGNPPMFVDTEGKLLQDPLPGPSFESTHPDSPIMSPYPAGEGTAVVAILELAQAEFLEHLTPCGDCGQLFFPTRREQKNCSTRCSKRAFSKTPADRERRARNARERYDITFGVPERRKKK